MIGSVNGKTHKKYLLIAVLIVAIIITTIGIYRQNSQIQYSPKKTNNIAGPIVIKAKQNISTENGTYSILPAAAGNLQIVDNYIIFWPEQEGGFRDDVIYEAEFKDYKTTTNEPLGLLRMKFAVSRDVDYDDLQKEALNKYGHFEASFNPFLEKLPYKEDYRFRISYAINESLSHSENEEANTQSDIITLLGNKDNWKEKKENYTVYIETLVFQSPDQSYDSYVKEVRQARQEAMRWISDQGVDPGNDIDYLFIPDDKTLQNPSAGREEVPIILDDDY